MNYELKDFEKDVLQASFKKPVLVDFWAEWCGPCRIIGPVLERLAEQNKGEWTLVKVNSDEHPELSEQYGIRSIPNVKLFFKGEVINEFVGALPENLIKNWLKKSIPNKYADMLEKAEHLVAVGEEKQAQKILENILSNDPENTSAKVRLSKLLLFNNPQKAESLVAEIDQTNENEDLINSIKTLATILNADIEKNLEDTPTKTLFMDAINKLKFRKFDLALEKLIEIIREDRFYADDLARKVCIAIFKFLGEENEITSKYRRDFSRALYI